MGLSSLNHFVMNPTSLDISRSKFNRPFTHKTTFKSGKLIPLFFDEVLPGDTFQIDWSSVIRMLTPAVPVMDNAFFDMYFFFVPFRLCTTGTLDWNKVQGENTSGYWAPSSESTLINTNNTFTLTGRSVTVGSFGNYIGLPIGSSYSGSGFDSTYISLMPFNAYIKIWNEWFRDQNTQAPKSVLNGSSTTGINDLLTGCYDVNRLHDYFTSSLPSPQKGASVLLPLGDKAAVKTSGTEIIGGSGKTPMKVKRASDGADFAGTLSPLAQDEGKVSVLTTFPTPIAGAEAVYPSNLYADLANATAATVNELRQAFAIQRLLEKDARGGTRYREMLKAHFGVTIPDLTIQVPEYLGGKRVPLNITQVLQTSETSNTSPLGATGAFSNTSVHDNGFIKSFNEYGYIIGVGCVRTEQSYSQGIPRFLTKTRRYDFYLPALANIGEQPIYKRDLYVKSGSYGTSDATAVFGYQEAWADYRFHPSMVTGALAPNANDTTLTAWTYTNKFTAAPTLNSSFMVQPDSQIGDTLVVTNTANQFVADFYFDVTCTRPMPLYSIPGLIDHH